MAKAEAVLPESLRARVQALIAAKGIGMAAKLLGINASTVKCAALGGNVQPGTVALVEKKIAERDSQQRKP